MEIKEGLCLYIYVYIYISALCAVDVLNCHDEEERLAVLIKVIELAWRLKKVCDIYIYIINYCCFYWGINCGCVELS